MSYSVRSILTFLVFSIFLTACSGGGGTSDEPAGTTGSTPVAENPGVDELKASIRRMDLSDAQGFVITGSTTLSGKAAIRYKNRKIANRTGIDMDPNSLYKVNSSGTLERVAIRDGNDQEIARGLVQPFGLIEVDSSYLFMWFLIQSANPDDPVNDDDPVPYLVHKKTGLAYKAEGVIWQNRASCGSEGQACETIDNQYRKIRTDNNGNIYIGHNDTVYRIDTSDLGGSSITAQAVQSQYKIHSSDWDIDDAGSMLIFNGFDSNDAMVDIYLDLSDGSLSRVAQAMAAARENYNTMDAIFRGLDGNLYLVGYDASGINTPWLFQASQDQAKNLVLTARGDLGSDAPYLWGNHHRHVINGKLIYFNANIEGNGIAHMGEIFEFDHNTGRFFRHQGPAQQFLNGSDSIKQVTVSNGYMYFFGTDRVTAVDTVYRYDPATRSGKLFPTDVSSPVNDFDIGRIKVLGNNKVWFNAFRFSDSATVIGELDMDKISIEIIDTIDASEPQLIAMEAIHPADFVVVDGSYQDWAEDLRVTTDANDDGAAGHELSYLSYQQTESQFFALVEFDQNHIDSENGATEVTIDGLYSIVIMPQQALFTELASDTDISLADAGGLSATGQALEISVPLAALAGVGSTPVVTVQRYSLEAIGLSASYQHPEHTVTATLPRALSAAEDFIIQLSGPYELQISSAASTLINTGTSLQTDLSAAVSGLDTAQIQVVINDVLIGSPAAVLHPHTEDTVSVERDNM